MALSTRLRTSSRSKVALPSIRHSAGTLSGPSKPMSKLFSIARGTQSCKTSITVCAKSSCKVTKVRPVDSALASARSWFTVCVARTLERAICASACTTSLGSRSRCAKSACMRKPASGVFNWCAASAKKRRCVVSEAVSRSSKLLMDCTRGATSFGT